VHFVAQNFKINTPSSEGRNSFCVTISVFSPQITYPLNLFLVLLVRATFMNALLEGPPDSTASDILYVPPRLTCRNSVFSPKQICVLGGSQKKKLFSLQHYLIFLIAQSGYDSSAAKVGLQI